MGLLSDKALRWIEDHYPTATASKEALVRAYCAGVDEGLREAQEILGEAASELRVPKKKWPLP